MGVGQIATSLRAGGACGKGPSANSAFVIGAAGGESRSALYFPQDGWQDGESIIVRI